MASRFALVVVVGLLLLLLACVNATTTCDLRCWLNKLQVTVPPMTVSVSGAKADVSNIVGKDITLGKLASSWYPAGSTSSTGMTFKATGISVHVNCYVDAWYLGIIPVAGDAVITFANSDLTATIQVVKNTKDGLIDSFKMPTCVSNLQYSSFKITGTWSDAVINWLIGLMKDTITTKINSEVCIKVKGLIQTNATQLMGTVNTNLRPYLTYQRPSYKPITNSTLFTPLNKSPLVDLLRYAFNQLTGINGPLNLNTFFAKLSDTADGVVKLEDVYDLVNGTLSGVLGFQIPAMTSLQLNMELFGLGSLAISLSDMTISNMTTWQYFEFMTPAGDFLLNTHTAMSATGLYARVNLGVTVYDGAILAAGGAYLEEQTDIYIDVTDSELWAQWQGGWKSGMVDDYSNAMCFNVTCFGAVLDPDVTALTQAYFNTSVKRIELVADSGALEQDARDTLNMIVQLFVTNYSPQIPAFFNGVVAKDGVDFINKGMASFFGQNCNYEADKKETQVNPTWTAGSFATAGVGWAFVALFPGLLIARKLKTRIDNRSNGNDSLFESSATTASKSSPSPSPVEASTTTPSSSPTEEGGAVYIIGFGPKWFKEFFRTDPEGASLLLNSQINLGSQLLVPLVILCCVALFTASTASFAGSAIMMFTFGAGRAVKTDNLFEWGLLNLIKKTWHFHVYSLAILLAIFSLIWPYLKLAAMIWCWCIPTRYTPYRIRGWILVFLDWFGKWSLLDTFVMALLMVAFRFGITFPTVNPYDVTTPVKMDTYVNPAFGFSVFLVATIISLFTTHLVLYHHRKLRWTGKENNTVEARKWRPVFMYCNGPAWLSKRRVLVWIIRVLITVLLLGSIPMITLGVSLTSFAYQYMGLAGWGLDLVGQDTVRQFSVFSIAADVPKASNEPHYWGCVLTQISLYVCCYVIPILNIVAMFVIWIVPLQRRFQMWLFTVCEVLNAWNCVDVITVTLFLTREISKFSGKVVGGDCSWADPYISKFFLDKTHGNSTCFQVKCTFDSGLWVVFCAMLLYWVSAVLVHLIAHHTLVERATPPPLPAEVKFSSTAPNMVVEMESSAQPAYPSTIPSPLGVVPDYTVAMTPPLSPTNLFLVPPPPDMVDMIPVSSAHSALYQPAIPAASISRTLSRIPSSPAPPPPPPPPRSIVAQHQPVTTLFSTQQQHQASLASTMSLRPPEEE